mgnify:CR=1 FL=1
MVMDQGADLYTILRLYATKYKTPTIGVATFISFLEKYAKHYAQEREDLAFWAVDTGRKIWAELPKLAEEGKIKLHTDEKGTLITIPQFYLDVLQQAYKRIEDTSELPLPDEGSLQIKLPPDMLKTVNLEIDLPLLVANPPVGPLPVYKLVFPESFATALIPGAFFARRLLEIALLKLRHYLRNHNNKEYIQHKLAPAFMGKESLLKDALNQLMIRPLDALREMERAGDFSFPFWAYLTSQVKNDIKKKNDFLPEDIAALEAAYIIDVYNNYYKGKVTRQKEAENAFRNLENQLDKPPYCYTLDDIIRFTDSKGVPLLGQYSQEALEEYLKRKTTHAEKDSLPELLIVHGASGEKWFVKKSKLLPLCFKLLGEARPRIRNTLSQRWFKLLKEYQEEPAMYDPEAYEAELWDITQRLYPTLVSVLKDPQLYLVHEELERSEKGLPEQTRLFYKGALVPLSELLLLRQKDLLADVRMLLPFWYSIPMLVALISFFKRKKSKAKNRQSVPSSADTDMEKEEAHQERTVKKHDRSRELRNVAETTKTRLIPPGYTLDSYMDSLLEKWNRLINPQAKENLTEDVRALTRDYLRKTIRSLRHAPFTQERLNTLAETLVDSPALQKIPNRDALKIYIQLYMAKLLLEESFGKI